MASSRTEAPVAAPSVAWPLGKATSVAGVCLPLLSLLLLNLSPLVLQAKLTYTYDLLLFDYPAAVLSHAAWQSGQIPYWNPYHSSGAPFLADPSTAALYPLNVVLHQLPFVTPATVLCLSTMLHVILAYVGMYAYLRTIGCQRVGAVYAAAAYSFGTYTLIHLDWVSATAISALLPLTFTALERARLASNGWTGATWTAAGGASLAAQWLAGFPQLALYTSLFAAAYFVWRSSLVPSIAFRTGTARGALIRTCAFGVVFLVVAVGLSAIQTLPALEFLSLSNRSNGYVDDTEPGGFVALRYGRLLYGVAGGEAHGTYLGGAALLLVAFAILIRGSTHTRFLSLAGIGSLVLVAKPPRPVFHLLRLVPGYASVHVHFPERILIVAIFCASALSGLAVAALFDSQLPISKRRRALALASVIATAALAVPLLVGYVDLGTHVPQLLFFLLALALAAAYLAVGKPARSLQLVLVGALVLDLSVNYQALRVQFIDYEAHFASSKTAPVLQQLTRGDLARVVGLDLSRPWGGYDTKNISPHLITGNSAWVYGLGDAQGYNPVHLQRYWEYLAALNRGTGVEYHIKSVQNLASPLLRYLNVRYVITRSASKIPGGLLAGQVQLSDDRPIWKTPPLGAPVVDRLVLISWLDKSIQVKQGELVGRVVAETTGGEAIEWPVRAGIETSERFYDDPHIRRQVRHERAQTAADAPPGRYSATLQLPRPAALRRLRFEFVPVAAAPLLLWTIERIEEPRGIESYAESLGDWDGYRIWELRDSLPRAMLVPAIEVERDDERALERLQEEDFDPRRRVLFSESPPPGIRIVDRGAHVDLPSGRAAITSYDLNRIEVAADSVVPSVLVLSEIYYPAWQALVDGETATVYRVNYTFRGVAVPAGQHQVVLFYDDVAFRLGGLISGASALLVFGLALLSWRTRHTSRWVAGRWLDAASGSTSQRLLRG